MTKKIILTGGGTAGHIMPNLALLPYLKPHFDEIHYIGGEQGLEVDILKKYPEIIFHAIPTVKLERKLTLRNLLIPFKLWSSTAKARQIIKQVKPDIIFSKGGYVGLPVTYSHGKIPVVLHESDMSLGLSNKLALNSCRCACTSFPLAISSRANIVNTGAPIRRTIYSGSAATALSQLKFSSQLPILLVFGGSLGAKAINDALYVSLPILSRQYNIVHIVGGKNLTASITNPNYRQLGFVDNIADYFAAASLVVSRGGAGALFELICLCKPTLCIPLPKGNSRGDQIENADYFTKLGYIHSLAQEHLTDASFVNAINYLQIKSGVLISKMSQATNIDGTRKIADIIIKLSSPTT